MKFNNAIKSSARGNGAVSIRFALIVATSSFLTSVNTLAMDQSSHSCNKADAFTHSRCWFLGVGAGTSHIDPKPNSLWKITDNSDTSLKIFGGASFGEHWFTELSYENLGAATLKSLNPTEPTASWKTADYTAWALSGGYWLRGRTETWDAYLKAGLSHLESDDKLSSIHENSSNQLVWGIGAEWRFTEKWFARVELTTYDKDARTLGLSLARYLGSTRKNSKAQATPVIAVTKPVTEAINTDLDADGIINEQDACPSSPADSAVDSRGCPLLETVTLNVQFDTNKSVIKNGFMTEMNNVSDVIKRFGNVHVTVEGHTDWQGKQVNNQLLSESRAKAVADILMEKTGLKSENFTIIGHGELKPITDNTTPEGRYKNRRVVIMISQQ